MIVEIVKKRVNYKVNISIYNKNTVENKHFRI